ncbi:MAG: hypothetical protein JXR83_12810 [Deltaproteobacteria bacterium]|nr:hypothetical protein [Deltaproteobacteria bacterium]
MSAPRLFQVLLLTCLLGGCGEPGAERCGPGTERQGDLCVVVVSADARCGEGTAVDPETGACEPLVSCGEGTVLDPETGGCEPLSECGPGTYFDIASRSCLPEEACGPGTVANPDTGQCEPAVICGAGTTLDPITGLCEPDPPCAAGAVFDPASGLCVSALRCGEGQVVVQGNCVDPEQGLVIEADQFEGVPDENDPLNGGTPEAVLLEPLGERAVFVGTIDRPADISGNGSLTQDRDVWRFEGRTGQFLRIQVASLGLPNPAFVLEGPRGYLRTSTIGFESDVSREVILPYDGIYDLTVVPSAHLARGELVGARNAAYVGAIEALPAPSWRYVNAGENSSTAAVLGGTLRGLGDNFYAVNVAANSAVQVVFDSIDDSITAAVLVFGLDGRLLADIAPLAEDGWAGFHAAASNDAVVVFDWVTASGPGDIFSARLHKVPMVRRGAVPADYHTVTGSQNLRARETGAFELSTAVAQVVLTEVNSLYGPDIQVVGPGGTRSRINDDSDFFFYADPGTYLVFVNNDRTSDSSSVSLTLSLLTPYDLGALDFAARSSAAVRGADLIQGFGGFQDAWAVVTTSVPALVETTIQVAAGDPDVFFYSIDGVRLRAVRRPHLDRPIFIINRDPRPILIQLVSDDRNAIGWSINCQVSQLPTQLDTEPNDHRVNAVLLGTPPVRIRGLLAADERDVFRFQLEAPLAPQQAVQVLFDNMQSDSVSSSITDAAYVNIYDALYTPLASLPHPESYSGTLGVNTVTYVPGYEGTGPFYIEIFGDFVRDEKDYLLDVRVVDFPVENEPNDRLDTADGLGSLPAQMMAYRDEGDMEDLFWLELDQDLAPGTSLLASVRNFENDNALTVALETAQGDQLMRRSLALNTLQIGGLLAGRYYLRVSAASGGEPIYKVSAGYGGPVELEPNDAAFVANQLAELAAAAPIELHGYVGSGDEDVFRFSLAQPLAPQVSVVVQALNCDDNSAIALELYQDTGVEASALRSHDRGVEATAVVAGPGTTGPFTLRLTGTSARADRYLLTAQLGGQAEIEPNDDRARATAVVPDAGPMIGSIGAGETDVYSLELATGAQVRTVLENVSDGTSLTLSARAFDFNFEIGGATGFRVTLPSATWIAGTYYFVITSQESTVDATDLYELRIEVTP